MLLYSCWHTCSYKKGFPDYCHDNKLVQAKPHFDKDQNKTVVAPFAIIWFCDAKNVRRNDEFVFQTRNFVL